MKHLPQCLVGTFIAMLFCCAAATVNASAQVDSPSVSSASYVGGDQCIGCHKEQADLWQGSDHFKAMAKAQASTVLGEFSGQTLKFHNIEYQFFEKDGVYFVRTLNSDAKSSVFEVEYTFGHFPLQQYLVDIGQGRYQALNVAWDSRKKSEGGQRWYHLQAEEDIDPQHPFFWTSSFQNWNSRCADCHSTNLDKAYDQASDSYQTTWTDINVSCEACHGPGSEHIDLMSSSDKPDNASTNVANGHSGLAYALTQTLTWQYEKDDPIAKPVGEVNTAYIDSCGGCHSRRQVIADPNTPGDYHQKYRIQSIDDGLYFADGQIQDEVYVLGSFMQSKMHQAGVTCMNCHNAHSGELIAEPNQVCAQCHQPAAFETQEHTMHAQQSDVECVDCHMPERVYMGVDARRDHSFSIPRPKLASEQGVPLACLNCHQDKDAHWAEGVFKNNDIQAVWPEWIEAKAKAAQLDSIAVTPLYKSLSDDDLPGIIKATLVKNLASFPSREAMTAVAGALGSDDPMVRAAAVSASRFMDVQTRAKLLLSHYAQDESQAVRFEVAAVMIDYLPLAQGDDKKRLSALIQDYRHALAFSADFPSSQLALAELELRIGNHQQADTAYKQAIKQGPAFVPALLNYSHFLRAQGRSDEELGYLQQALAMVPESAAAQHAMGLYQVRQGRYDEALPYLMVAANTLGLDASPRYAYVYAVALDAQGQTTKAVSVLAKANKRWPRQYENLVVLVQYLEKLGRTDVIPGYVRVLNSFAAGSPQVQQWVQRYGLF